ncbi:PREDICTED: uncharacterized protein LOC107327142 [Acropora digitifera]|uniref:uncharacterized protein LOC107327142 n=1 Tax=Acropora digitifera TaxID=70779 RepID=UPI00077A8F9F|nr:PREDICTED: uncharacterized protein LOC107327142 [Acropora digitifera]
MDDLMPCVKSVEEARLMRKEITELGDKAGFDVRKWISLGHEVIADIPDQERAAEIDLSKAELAGTKTLGVLWNAHKDKFSFQFSAPPDEFVHMKRSVLKKTATIFDPPGFLSPFTVRGKLLMQESWTKTVTWDEVLPPQLERKWKTWFGELPDLAKIKIPRGLKDSHSKEEQLTVHTFTDASEKAYAAVVYARYEFEDGSIGTLCKALEIEQTKVTYWVDSCNVGYWIHSQSRNLKPFVAHRVEEIYKDSNPEQWRYVPGKLNPPDHGTRGLTFEELVENECWWGGSTFLNQPNRNSLSEGSQELPQNHLRKYRTKPAGKLEIGISLVRVRSWVSRFIDNCRKSIEQRATGEVTRDELKRTEEKVISEAQNDAFSEDITAIASGKELPRKSYILPFTPMVIDGLLRSNTRLRYCNDLPDETKYPIILPKKYPVTELVVKYHHETELGLNYPLNHVREKYLVVHGRERVKKVIKECFECQRRFRGKPGTPQMAPLPAI